MSVMFQPKIKRTQKHIFYQCNAHKYNSHQCIDTIKKIFFKVVNKKRLMEYILQLENVMFNSIQFNINFSCEIFSCAVSCEIY